MKKEVSFFKQRPFNAKTFIAMFRALGYTDEQIKAEMQKIIEYQEKLAAIKDKKAQS